MNDDNDEEQPDDEEGVGNILMAEYLAITRQIIHWDTFFWTKARFFLAAEGIALLATVDRIATAYGSTKGLDLGRFSLLLGMVLLNWFLCRVWFLTGRRNRQFLNFRFERGLQIEEDPALRGRVRLYHYQEQRLADPSLRGQFSHYSELNIPWIFAAAWLFVLVAGISLLERQQRCVATIISLALALLGYVLPKLYDAVGRRTLPPETVRPA